MAKYRRRLIGWGSETWHWRPECPSWPTNWYEERDSLPNNWLRCKECEGADTEVMGETIRPE